MSSKKKGEILDSKVSTVQFIIAKEHPNTPVPINLAFPGAAKLSTADSEKFVMEMFSAPRSSWPAVGEKYGVKVYSPENFDIYEAMSSGVIPAGAFYGTPTGGEGETEFFFKR